MSTVRALIQIRAGEIGSNPEPLSIALEEGTIGKVPSPDFRDAVREAVERAVQAAGIGGIAEVRITVLPAGLAGVN